jgi:hypothetical protein
MGLIWGRRIRLLFDCVVVSSFALVSCLAQLSFIVFWYLLVLVFISSVPHSLIDHVDRLHNRLN